MGTEMDLDDAPWWRKMELDVDDPEFLDGQGVFIFLSVFVLFSLM